MKTTHTDLSLFSLAMIFALLGGIALFFLTSCATKPDPRDPAVYKPQPSSYPRP
jgi:hypothetical protein